MTQVFSFLLAWRALIQQWGVKNTRILFTIVAPSLQLTKQALTHLNEVMSLTWVFSLLLAWRARMNRNMIAWIKGNDRSQNFSGIIQNITNYIHFLSYLKPECLDILPVVCHKFIICPIPQGWESWTKQQKMDLLDCGHEIWFFRCITYGYGHSYRSGKTPNKCIRHVHPAAVNKRHS